MIRLIVHEGQRSGTGPAKGARHPDACFQVVIFSFARRTNFDRRNAMAACLEQHTDTAGGYALAETGDDATCDEYVFHGR